MPRTPPSSGMPRLAGRSAMARRQIDELTAFAAEIRNEGFTRVLLLAWGLEPPPRYSRSSRSRPAPPPGRPSTHGSRHHRRHRSGEPARPDLLPRLEQVGQDHRDASQYAYMRPSSGFQDRGRRAPIRRRDGRRLSARPSRAGRGFRRVFRNPADIGGRYPRSATSAWSPPRLASTFARSARAAAARKESLEPSPPGTMRSAGAFLGGGARAGRNKLTIETAKTLRPLGYWIEARGREHRQGEHGSRAHRGRTARSGASLRRRPVLLTLGLQGEPDPDLDRPKANGRARRRGSHRSSRRCHAGEFYRWKWPRARGRSPPHRSLRRAERAGEQGCDAADPGRARPHGAAAHGEPPRRAPASRSTRRTRSGSGSRPASPRCPASR